MLTLVILQKDHRFHHGDVVIPIKVCQAGPDGKGWEERAAMLLDHVGDSFEGMPIVHEVLDSAEAQIVVPAPSNEG